MSKEDRLKAFETMLQTVQENCRTIEEKMKHLKE